MGKIIIALFTLTILASSLISQSLSLPDDTFAPLYNPSAIAFGNSDGITFYGQYQDNLRTHDYKIWYNRETFSFLYRKADKRDNYQVTSASRLFRNSYAGLTIRWQNSNIGDAIYDISFLNRPLNWLSIGLKGEDIFNSTIPFGIGAGIKPFTLDRGRNIALYSDLYFDKSDGNYTTISEVIGLRTDIIPGTILSSYYDLKNETFGINFSLTHNGLRTGNKISHNTSEGSTSGAYYINISETHYPRFPLFAQPIRYQKVDLKKPIVEEKEQSKIGPFTIVRNQQTVRDLIEKIEAFKEDERVHGIVLKNPNLATSYANVEQLERTFDSFRESGKYVITYANSYGNLNYAFLAAISDELYLNPNGAVNLRGFSVSAPYFKEMFKKIGVQMYDLKSHDFKTGLNTFTESGMTDEEYTAYNEMLEYMFGHMASMIERGRGDNIHRSGKAIINNGPYLSAPTALEEGLVDGLIYEQELDNLLRNKFDVNLITKEDPSRLIVYEWSKEKETKVALINAVGTIRMGEGTPGRSIGSQTISKQLRKAREDDTVKAVLIRIDSGGGSAFASDVIAKEVKLIKEAGKPVIASFAGAAASGGYYIAAYADKIVAETTTITGSIGVTGLIPNLKEMFDKLYINWETVRAGERSGFLDPFQYIDERDIEKMQQMIAEKYDQFLETVSVGRTIPKNELHESAQGRIWIGAHAYDLGLVDEIGGIDRAVEMIKELLDEENIVLKDYSYTYNTWQLPLTFGAFVTGRINLPYIGTVKERLYENLSLYENEPVQYKTPLFKIEGID